ncbi:MAG: hypothetical protein OCD02_15955 [Spirochaetaceae bacterium]
MRKKNKKRTPLEFFADAWLDLKFKLIIIGSVFIAFIIIIILVVTDIQNDQMMLENKANKYETYIDQLLLKKFSIDELKDMNSDQLKIAVDMVIDETSNRVVNAPTLKDFILPVKDDNYADMFKLTREAKMKWTQEDVDQFWIDLETMNIKDLDENNFEYLKAKLKDIR